MEFKKGNSRKMKSCQGYSGRFFEEMRNLRLSLLEKFLITSLVLMCLISAADSLMGRDLGNFEQVKMAKLQAQQEMMALRMSQSR
jgi:hypothetical protein